MLPSLPGGGQRPKEGFTAAPVSREVSFPSDEGHSRRLSLHLLYFRRLQLKILFSSTWGSERILSSWRLLPTSPSVTSSPRAMSPARPGPCLPRSLPSAGVPAPPPSARRPGSRSRAGAVPLPSHRRPTHTPGCPCTISCPAAEPSSGGPGAQLGVGAG